MNDRIQELAAEILRLRAHTGERTARLHTHLGELKTVHRFAACCLDHTFIRGTPAGRYPPRQW